MKTLFIKHSVRVIEWTIILFLLTMFIFQRQANRDLTEKNDLSADQLVAATREILQFATLEVNLNQFYEYNRESVKFSSIKIPFTSQTSIVAVKGKALYGVDVESFHSIYDETEQKLVLETGPPRLLALDLDYQFVDEKDTFLNPINPQDRNEMLKKIKSTVAQDLSKGNFEKQTQDKISSLLNQLSKFGDFNIEWKSSATATDDVD